MARFQVNHSRVGLDGLLRCLEPRHERTEVEGSEAPNRGRLYRWRVKSLYINKVWEMGHEFQEVMDGQEPCGIIKQVPRKYDILLKVSGRNFYHDRRRE